MPKKETKRKNAGPNRREEKAVKVANRKKYLARLAAKKAANRAAKK